MPKFRTPAQPNDRAHALCHEGRNGTLEGRVTWPLSVNKSRLAALTLGRDRGERFKDTCHGLWDGVQAAGNLASRGANTGETLIILQTCPICDLCQRSAVALRSTFCNDPEGPRGHIQTGAVDFGMKSPQQRGCRFPKRRFRKTIQGRSPPPLKALKFFRSA